MKIRLGVVTVIAASILSSCSKSEPPAAPAASAQSRAEQQRVEFFGAEVAADPAVTWRQTGLGIKTLQAGEGNPPGLGDKVRVHYTGTLKDGTVFDDTREKGKPAEFELGRLIPGMTAGIGAISPGGRALIYVPPSLGYGAMRAGKIPPVSGLVFDVELLAIVPPPAPKAP